MASDCHFGLYICYLQKGKILTLNKCVLLDHWQFGLSYVFHISGLRQEAISGTAPHHASLSNTSSLNRNNPH